MHSWYFPILKRIIAKVKLIHDFEWIHSLDFCIIYNTEHVLIRLPKKFNKLQMLNGLITLHACS